MVDHATTVVPSADAKDKMEAAVAGSEAVRGTLASVLPDMPSMTT